MVCSGVKDRRVVVLELRCGLGKDRRVEGLELRWFGIWCRCLS